MDEQSRIFLAALKNVTGRIRLGKPEQLLALGQRLQRDAIGSKHFVVNLSCRPPRVELRILYYLDYLKSERFIVFYTAIDFLESKTTYNRRRVFNEELDQFINDVENGNI